jgi:oxygen-independent coproporphyrinogen-3 oxidase
MVESGRVTLPDDDAVAELYLSCAARLAAEGFEHYEISNFALPGCRSRHNMRYWQRSEYLGIGAAAHSFFDGTRRYFTADTAAFLDSADGSEIGWETDDPADPIEETLILALRLADGLDLTAFSALAGESAAGKIGSGLEKLIHSGHARRTAQGYALTAEGWLVSNTILSDLLLLL